VSEDSNRHLGRLLNDSLAEGGAPRSPSGSRFGRYTLAERLGTGGMGEVWKAWDPHLGRWTAVKILLGTEPAELERFRREARAVAELTHPGIAAIYEIGEVEGRHYISMQHIAGRSLREYGDRPPRHLAQLVRDAAFAVHAAHEKGILHRDLKPSNIMVESLEEGHRVYVLDFGLAKRLGSDASLSLTGQIVGTPAYMSPEQARAGEVGFASDIYSLGVTLYQLVAGKTPFEDSDVYALLRRIVEEDPPRLRTARPSADGALETIVGRCLEKEPRRRYASAKALAEDLDRYIRGEPILARAPTLGFKIRRFTVRRRAYLGAAAAVLVAVSAVSALLVPRWIEARNRARGEERARAADREAARARESSLQELAALRERTVAAREWLRQPFRKPEEIRREVEEAVRSLDAFVARHPSLAQGFYVRGSAWMILENWDRAESDLRGALAREPQFAPPWLLIARIRLEQYSRAIRFVSPDQREEKRAQAAPILQEAEEALRRGSKSDSLERWGLSRTREEEVTERLGEALRVHYVEGRREEADRLLREAHRISPSEEYCIRLAAWSRTPAEALEWADRAVAIAPHSSRAWLKRADIHHEVGKEREAVEDYSRAIAIRPEDAILYRNRAGAHAALGEYEAAVADYTLALDRRPDFAEAMNDRGVARSKIDDWTGATADFEAACRLDSSYYLAHFNLGNARTVAHRWDEAVAEFTQALLLRPGYVPALHQRGFCRQARGQASRKAGRGREARESWREALADYTEVLRLDPKHAEAFTNRGMVYAGMHEHDLAMRDFGEVIQLRPASGVGYWLRAELRLEMGDRTGALEDARAAAERELTPDQRERVMRILK